jgi:hypothetical protein
VLLCACWQLAHKLLAWLPPENFGNSRPQLVQVAI